MWLIVELAGERRISVCKDTFKYPYSKFLAINSMKVVFLKSFDNVVRSKKRLISKLPFAFQEHGVHLVKS